MGKVFEKGLATMADKRDISQKSQKLFNYLICMAGNPNSEKKRVFRQREINLEQIHRTIGLSVPSIKKYWFELEESHHIVYGNNGRIPEEELRLGRELSNERSIYEMTEEERFEIWKKLWAARKKHRMEYYQLSTGPTYRNIPKETIQLLNEQIQMSEQDIKIYQYLLTYREVGIAKMYKEYPFSMEDLRGFLGLSMNQKNHLSIYKSLLLLERYGLIQFREVWHLNSKNVRIRSFVLTDVGFYVISDYMNYSEEERQLIDQQINQEIEAILSKEQ